MQVYSVHTITRFHTKYIGTPIEECGDDFLTPEEMDEVGFDKFYDGHNHLFIVLNAAAIDEVVADIVLKYKERPVGRKTMKYEGFDNELHYLMSNEGWYTARSYLLEQLKKHNLKLRPNGHVWPYKPAGLNEAANHEKNKVRTGVAELVLLYLLCELDLPCKIWKLRTKKVQDKLVLFAHRTCGLTLQQLRDWYDESDINNLHISKALDNKEDNTNGWEYAFSYWKSVVDLQS